MGENGKCESWRKSSSQTILSTRESPADFNDIDLELHPSRTTRMQVYLSGSPGLEKFPYTLLRRPECMTRTGEFGCAAGPNMFAGYLENRTGALGGKETWCP